MAVADRLLLQYKLSFFFYSLQAKFDTLVSDHQRSLEELKATLSSDHTAPEGQEQDAQELRAALESLKLEHQLEVENLKAKHKIEAAILTKEREDLCSRLQEAKEQLAEGSQALRTEAEARSGKQALEEATDKLQKAEQRLAEMEKHQMEQDRSREELRERLELSEKKMSDYQALQKAQAESQEEIQKLEENLRVTANQLQAIQSDRYTSHDANVRGSADWRYARYCSVIIFVNSFFFSGDRGQRNIRREDEAETEF